MTMAAVEHACGTHAIYKLTCEDYDGLRAQYDGRCWRCREADGGQVDHAHPLGLAAVRGYLCAPCNIRMAHVDGGGEPNDDDLRYMADPWWVAHKPNLVYVPDNRTALRNLRAPNDLWGSAMSVARGENETLTSVILRALRAYIADPQAFNAAVATIRGRR